MDVKPLTNSVRKAIKSEQTVLRVRVAKAIFSDPELLARAKETRLTDKFVKQLSTEFSEANATTINNEPPSYKQMIFDRAKQSVDNIKRDFGPVTDHEFTYSKEKLIDKIHQHYVKAIMSPQECVPHRISMAIAAESASKMA